MKKRFLRLAAAVLALAICTAPASYAATNREGETMLRVGLASTSSGNELGALVGANLWNNTGYGAGYRFGYYDKGLNFVELARTDEDVEQVSIIKTQNTWFKGSDRNSFSNTDNGGSVVGCFHLRIPGSYVDFEEAAEDAALHHGFVAWVDGSYQVRVGAYVDQESAEEAQAAIPNSEVVGTSQYGMNVILTGSPEILFQYDCGAGSKLGVAPDVTGADDVRTWFWDIKYRGGFSYERINGGNLTVVNVLELEDYVKGVTPYEMGRLWPLEALKTQATCARTYAMRRMNGHKSQGFDLCNSDHCQVYNGVGSKNKNWGPSEVSDRAVEETAGQVLWYQNRLAETVYSSSHGGASENAKYIWGTDTEKEHPYLCGVLDPYEEKAAEINPRSSWSIRYTSEELENRLHNKGYGAGSGLDHLVLTYSDLGNVIRLEVHWDNGEKNTFKASDGRNSIRNVFGVYSIRFVVNGQTAQPGGGEEVKPEGFPVNGGRDTLNSLDGLYAINGSGVVRKTDSSPCIITGDGSVVPLEQSKPENSGTNEGGGTVRVSGSSYVFNGGGWGHQVGMSQFGAYAMAKEGFDYDEICEFYFPGTHVGPIKK